jgi:hypothetical protein
MTRDPYKTSLERAFDLARSGECGSMDHIKRRLIAEGYNANVLAGRSLAAQLKSLISDAKNPAH